MLSDGTVSVIKELPELFEVCNKQNVSIHKSLWPAVQALQREIYCHRMENPCSRENAMNINIFELKLEPSTLRRIFITAIKMRGHLIVIVGVFPISINKYSIE